MQKYKRTAQCDLEFYFYLGKNTDQILNNVDLHNSETWI